MIVVVIPALAMIVAVVVRIAMILVMVIVTIAIVVILIVAVVAMIVILARATRWRRDPGSGEANSTRDQEELEPPGFCRTRWYLSRGLALSLRHRLCSAHDTLRSGITLAQRSAL